MTLDLTRHLRSTLKFALGAAVLIVIACSGLAKTVTAIAINPKNPNILYVATNDRVYKSRDRGETWTIITEGMGGARILSLAIHPIITSTVYAGTMGDAVYRTMNGGLQWSIINAGLKEHVTVVNAFVLHPKDPQMILAATTVGIFKTTNGGMLWDEMSNKGMASVYVVSLIIDQTHHNTFYAGTSGGVYRSINAGKQWEPLHQGMIEEKIETGLALGVNSLLQDPHQPDIIYAATTRGAYRSTDRGGSWTRIRGGLIDGFISSMILETKDSRVLYAGTSQGIFKTQDGGKSWRTINQGLTNLTIRCLAMDPQNPKILYACSHGGLFKSIDSGNTWKVLEFGKEKENLS